jgi:hypothetical protein
VVVGKDSAEEGRKELLCCAGKLYWREVRAVSGRKHQVKGKENGIEAAVTEIKRITLSYRFMDALYLIKILDLMCSLI